MFPLASVSPLRVVVPVTPTWMPGKVNPLGSVTVIAMPARLFVAGARRGAAGVVVAGGVVAGGAVAGGVVAGGVVAGGVVAGAVGLGAGAGVVAGGAGFGWLVPSCGLAGVVGACAWTAMTPTTMKLDSKTFHICTLSTVRGRYNPPSPPGVSPIGIERDPWNLTRPPRKRCGGVSP